MPAKTFKTIKRYIRIQGFDHEKKSNKLYEVTDLKRAIEDQAYTGYDQRKVDRIVVQMAVDDSLESLLAGLM